MADDVKMHVHPVWREKADFLLNMKIDSEDDAVRYEQLWVKRHDENRFEICCIPFFLYDMALGDIVRVSAQDGRQVMEGVEEIAGHHTFRVWFGDTQDTAAKDEVLQELSRLDCLFEWFSEYLLAIDAPDDAAAIELAEFLLYQEERERLQYETGRTE